MAEELEDRPLSIFVSNCIDDLNSGSLSPEEAFVAMRQYKPLRDLLDSQKDEVAAKLANPDEIKKFFLDLLSNEQKLISEGAKPPVELDEPKYREERIERAKAFQEARVRTDDAIKHKLTNLEAERRTYARRVANAWVAELRNRRLYDVAPETIENKILEATETLPAATTKEATQAILVSALSDAIQTDATLSPHKEALRAVTQTVEAPDVFIEAATIREQTNRIILESPDIARPDLLVTFVAQGVDAAKALSLTQIAEGLSLDINPAIDPTRPSVFSQAVATTTFQKLVAPAVDTILTAFPQEVREQAIEYALGGRWRELASPEGLLKLEEKFGKEVVSSPFFQQALAYGNNAFAKPTAPGGAAAGASKFVGDALGTIFGTGIDQKLINEYLELGKRVSLTPGQTSLAGAPAQTTFLQFYAAYALAYRPELFHTAFSGGRRILDWVGFGAKQAAGKLAGVALKGIATKLSATAIGAALGSVVPVVGNIIGAVVGFIGGKLLGGAWNGIKSLFGGGFIKRLFSGELGRWQDDFPLIAAVVVVLPIIILFLLPTFLNPQYIGGAAQESALADFGVVGPAGVTGTIAAPAGCGGNLVAASEEIKASLVNPPGSSLHGIWNDWNYSSLYPSLWTAETFRVLKNEEDTGELPCYSSSCNYVPLQIFWCTHMTKYSYARAGEEGPTSLTTGSQADWFNARSRYVKNGSVPIKSLPLGTVVFYAPYVSFHGHVAIFTGIDSGGECANINQSNAGSKSLCHTISVDGMTMESGGTRIDGFGLPPCATIK